jgi:type I restriction enzyme S subunit
MVNMKEIFAYDRIADQDCELAPLTERELAKYELRGGDLLFARQSLSFEGAGRCVIVMPSSNFRTWESHLMRVRLSPERADPRFYYYYFRSSAGRHLIESIIQQVAAAGIRGSDLSRLRVPVPPIETQSAIAQVLEAIDDKIAANLELAKTSARLAMVLFDRATREGGVQHSIDGVATLLVRGITPTYTESEEDSMLIVNQKCVKDQRVRLALSRRTTLKKVRLEKILQRNDVLVNSTGQGTLGRVARWTQSTRATVDSHVTIVRFDPCKVDAVCAGFAMLKLQPTIEELGEGSTGQTELSRVELGRLDITLPSLEAAEGLGVNLSQMTELGEAAIAENRTLAELRDTLIPELMSGRLRVKDAEKKFEEVA